MELEISLVTEIQDSMYCIPGVVGGSVLAVVGGWVVAVVVVGLVTGMGGSVTALKGSVTESGGSV